MYRYDTNTYQQNGAYDEVSVEEESPEEQYVTINNINIEMRNWWQLSHQKWTHQTCLHTIATISDPEPPKSTRNTL